MKQIDCSGLVLRALTGHVLADSLVDLLLGPSVVIASLPGHPPPDWIGQQLEIWDTMKRESIAWFVVLRSQQELWRPAAKIEGIRVIPGRGGECARRD